MEVLQQRARLLAQVRSFFAARNVLEVDTPHLSSASGTDPQVESLQLTDQRYLQTSPEFFMKRLLCAGSGDIYQLAHVFRNEPQGRQHRQEFMLLEWYRLNFDLFKLMDEVFELLLTVLPGLTRHTLSYREVFQTYLQIDDIFALDTAALQNVWQQHTSQQAPVQMQRQDWLDLLMASLIEPQLKGAVFVYHYPKELASLAKISNGLALRFELYVNGVELANGFEELQDANEQRARFEAENHKRTQMGLQTVSMDEDFLQALASPGLPPCAGVALGIDRLLMTIHNTQEIRSVQLF